MLVKDTWSIDHESLFLRGNEEYEIQPYCAYLGVYRKNEKEESLSSM